MATSTINIQDFGAIGDGTTKCTEFIQKAIDHCAAQGGGTVVIPGGRFLTGALRLRSHINLQVESGAVLLFANNHGDYPTVPTRWQGVECQAYSPCIYAYELTNVSISGRGTIDGQGAWWWKRHEELLKGVGEPNAREKEFIAANTSPGVKEQVNLAWRLQHLRPPLVQFMHCRDVSIEGVTVQNSPFWNTHIVYCDNVTVHGVSFRNPQSAPNGDGLDIDSSVNVRIANCHFDVGDDCLCLKSGIDGDGRRVNRATENVVITNCTMLHGHGGVVMGSEIAGSIRNVCISNCIFIGTERGIRLKANRARGGVVEDILVSNLLVKGTRCPFVINSYYICGHDEGDPVLFGNGPQPVTEKTPAFRNIHIQGMVARGVTAAAGFVTGLPESPVTGLVLENVEIETTQEADAPAFRLDELPRTETNKWMWAQKGFHCRYVKGLRLRNVRVHPHSGPALQVEDSDDVVISGFESRLADVEQAVIVRDVTNLRR